MYRIVADNFPYKIHNTHTALAGEYSRPQIIHLSSLLLVMMKKMSWTISSNATYYSGTFIYSKNAEFYGIPELLSSLYMNGYTIII